MKNFIVIAILSASCNLASADVPCVVTAVEGNVNDIGLKPGEGGASGPKYIMYHFNSGGDSDAGGGSGGPRANLGSAYSGGDGDGGGGPDPRIIYSNVLGNGGGGGPKLKFEFPENLFKGQQTVVLECDFNDGAQGY